MIAVLLLVAQTTDVLAPLDYDRLPRESLSGNHQVRGRGWTAEINVKIDGDKPDDPVFTERWQETGEVVTTEPLRLKLTRKLLSSTLDGDPIPPPDGDGVVWHEMPRTASFYEPLPEDPIAFRWARLLAWVPPGTAVRWPAMSESRIPSAVTTFVAPFNRGYAWEGFVGRRVRWTFTEPSGIQAEGDSLLDAKTGLPLHTRLTARGVHLPGGDGTPYRVTWVRKTTEIKP